MGSQSQLLSDPLIKLLSRLRGFERQAQRSQISEAARAKWLFWADIFRDEISYKSEFLECVVDRYIERIRDRQRAVLVLRPSLLG
jgi:hypothetical protein